MNQQQSVHNIVNICGHVHSEIGWFFLSYTQTTFRLGVRSGTKKSYSHAHAPPHKGELSPAGWCRAIRVPLRTLLTDFTLHTMAFLQTVLVSSLFSSCFHLFPSLSPVSYNLFLPFGEEEKCTENTPVSCNLLFHLVC